MGESFSRSLQACWDPEGTATLVRKKKAMRAAINKYDELLKRVESSDSSARDEIQRFDRENMAKGEGEYKGKFWQELQQHPDWVSVENRRKAAGL
mmetsp:Transcript_28643/g.52132  ORF Transcript_28643/g.52132 Transcript_28643/m.52132 type:complete len:95 (+) Transcript_28643:111-395(+)